MNSAVTTSATVSDKGQITLPKALRERLGIQPGTRLSFRVSGEGEMQVQVQPSGAASLFGLLHKPGEPVRTLADMQAGVTAAVAGRAQVQGKRAGRTK